jgi:hypothetical protein
MDLTKRRKSTGLGSSINMTENYNDLSYSFTDKIIIEGNEVKGLKFSGFIRKTSNPDIQALNDKFIVNANVLKAEEFNQESKLDRNKLYIQQFDSGCAFKILFTQKDLKEAKVAINFNEQSREHSFKHYKIEYKLANKISNIISSLSEKVDGLPDSYVYQDLLGVNNFLSAEESKLKLPLLSTKILGNDMFAPYGEPKNKLYISAVFNFNGNSLPVIMSVSKTMYQKTLASINGATNPDYIGGKIEKFGTEDKANVLHTSKSLSAYKKDSKEFNILDTQLFIFHVRSLINTYYLLQKNKTPNQDLTDYLIELGVLSKTASKVLDKEEDSFKDEESIEEYLDDEIPL